jgi:hypothetical protein
MRAWSSILLLCGFTFATAAIAAESSCLARIEQVGVHGDSVYRPLSGTPTNLTIDIRLRSLSNCQPVMTLRSNGVERLVGVSGVLPYRLFDAAGRPFFADGTTRIAVQGDNVRISLAILPGLLMRPGPYRDRLTLQLLDNERHLDSREIGAEVSVASQATIAAAGNQFGGFSVARGAAMDFGVLEQGKEREAFLFVRSNSSHVLRLRSDHGGVMRRQSGSASQDNSISYQVGLDGVVLDLKQPVTVRGRDEVRPEVPHTLRARIGQVEGKQAGVYLDVITVEVVLIE